ncbi:MAG: TolC family protein [Cyanobacteria bacterium REEB67]|nr:TolC family protein [Cyanobacteria bacterium REEB67]
MSIVVSSYQLQASAEETSAALRPPIPLSDSKALVGSVTLNQALDEAYGANPLLLATDAQRPVAEAGVVQAKIRINPTYQTELAPAEVTYRFVVASTTTQLGWKRQRRIEVARRLIDSTNATIRTMAWKIRQDTQSAYFELAVARQVLVVMEDYVATTQRLLLITKKRQEARDASGLELLRAEAAVADANAQLAPAQVRVQQALRQLNLVLGRQPEGTLVIAPPEFLTLGKLVARIPQFAMLISQAQESRPEFRQIAADLAVQQSKIKMAKSLWWPDVQTSVGLSSVPQVPAAEAHNYWGSHVLNKPLVMATVPLTVNDHGQGILATARTTFRQLEQQRVALINQVRQEVNLSYSNAYSAERQMDILFNDSLPKQARILSMSETGYRQGVLDLTAAITAQQTALTARLNFLQTATRYFQSLVDLERAVGRPIISDMMQNGVKAP